MKQVRWVGSSLDDLRRLPREVRRDIGFALDAAQNGEKHPSAKPLCGFNGAGVLEVVEDYLGNTFRAVYTVKFPGAVYVLHVFQKKSKSGIKTPKQDMTLIRPRLALAKEDYERLLNEGGLD